MRSSILTLALGLLAMPAMAGTFQPAQLLPDDGIDVLNANVAQDKLQRELFGDPHASVVIGRIDVYARFPYLEARYFQVVSDPGWNRLLFGESGRGLDAFDGKGSEFGELSGPHGLASDENGRIYVADTGNDRVLVFDTSSEFDNLELIPRYSIDGLSRPHDVAFSDGGTPFDDADDRLYIADTGKNRVLRVDLEHDRGQIVSEIGGLGSGEGRFAGPTAIAVGRDDSRNNDLVYVADSHSQRLVRLVDRGDAFFWDSSLEHDLPEVSDLDTDHWGNLYAASPRGGQIVKFAPDLLPVASMREGVERPRSFHVPMMTVHDHVRETVTRSGRGSGVMVDQWGDETGLRLLDLGVELDDIAVDGEDVHFTLTDHAKVTARLLDPRNGSLVHETQLGDMSAGRQRVSLDTIVATAAAGDLSLEIEAVSSYDDARRSSSKVSLTIDGDRSATPRNPTVLGASPNPFNPRTTIDFVVPNGANVMASLEVVDARGRIVKSIPAASFAPGRHGFIWDGNDDGGQAVSSGVYLYRVKLGEAVHAGKLALVK